MDANLERRMNIGLDWLLNSGIQNKNSSTSYGGYSSWYDIDKKENSFIYSEITGYVLNLFVTLKPIINNNQMTESIRLATNYLTNKAFDIQFGAVKCRYIKNKGWLNNYCAFDNMIVANSLINKYRLDKDIQSFNIAKTILSTLMSKFFIKDRFSARFISSRNLYQDTDEKWSTGFGSYHAKMAIPFLNMYDITKSEKYLDFVNKVLGIILKLQKPSGRFITNTRNQSTFLHPHLYTIEGLITAYRYLDMNIYKNSISQGLKWIDTLKNNDGGINGLVINNQQIPLDSPDINSQYLRCLILFEEDDIETKIISDLWDRISIFQNINTRIKKVKGGFRIGEIWFYDQNKNKIILQNNHINTWATVFALNTIYYLRYNDRNPFTIC